MGNVPIQSENGAQQTPGDVMYVPSITKNLVPVGQMTERGYEICFNKNGCLVLDTSNCMRVVARGKKVGRMFKLSASMP